MEEIPDDILYYEILQHLDYQSYVLMTSLSKRYNLICKRIPNAKELYLQEYTDEKEGCIQRYICDKKTRSKEGKCITEWNYYVYPERKSEYFTDRPLTHSISYYSNNKLQGTYRSYFDDNKIAEVYNYHNGVKNGLCTQYYYTGEIFRTAYYKNGKLEGLEMKYDDEGNLVSSTEFKNGSENGLSKYFAPYSLNYVECQYKNGVKDGIYKCWNISYQKDTISSARKYNINHLIQECMYKNNELHGKCVKWNTVNSNKLVKTEEMYYINGKLHGPYQSWHNFCKNGEDGNGRRKVITMYKYGEIHGSYDSWYVNGKKEIEAHYSDGILNGSYTRFYDNGQVNIKCHYLDGIYHGNYTSYHKTTKKVIDVIHKCIEYRNGDIIGTYREYNKDGKIIMEIEYINGMKHGKFTKYYGCEKDIKWIECYYYEDMLHGSYKKYHKDGKLWKHIIYHLDKII
ncbi:MORN-repeat protein [Orpheovirus IHUMI-LCC2]|uniref:MORN-repeat protein n=1 Tax=Orpheovirus IHUMI-LCC2 TaxID=2023057 RepID=A0A2I2L4S9_9VIRU|nr:MORN-repeat protein [Orpheovirus IHUMI-LCC2]SNW62521.1 MORN-repeat protein [Orpheovirus IHUMI-LCC2]